MYNSSSYNGNIYFLFYRAFTCLCYTADGKCILAAGRSKFVCIYNVQEKILLKKFEITCNLSFDAVQVFIVIFLIYVFLSVKVMIYIPQSTSL